MAVALDWMRQHEVTLALVIPSLTIPLLSTTCTTGILVVWLHDSHRRAAAACLGFGVAALLLLVLTALGTFVRAEGVVGALIDAAVAPGLWMAPVLAGCGLAVAGRAVAKPGSVITRAGGISHGLASGFFALLVLVWVFGEW